MRFYILSVLPCLALCGFFSWGRKEKVKTEVLKKATGCERVTRNGDQLFVHFWGRKTVDGPVFQTSVTNKFENDPIQVRVWNETHI